MQGFSATQSLPTSTTLKMYNYGRSKPQSAVKLCGVTFPCRVFHLTGDEFNINIDKNATGFMVLQSFCSQHNLSDDYFSFYIQSKMNERKWINASKSVFKQFKNPSHVLHFGVKFYPPDPCKIEDPLVRYMLCLQIRRDVIEGRLKCSGDVRVLLSGYALQSEYGDFNNSEEYRHAVTANNLTDTPELNSTIMDIHKTFKELTTAESDLYFLDIARKLPFYSYDFFSGESKEGSQVVIGVGCTGLCLYFGDIRVYRFTWLKILKLSYRGINFTIKFRGDDKNIVKVYKMRDNATAQMCWVRARECHMFFRLRVVLPDRGGVANRFNSMRRGRTDPVRTDPMRSETMRTEPMNNLKAEPVVDNVDYDKEEDLLRRAVIHVTGVSQTALVERININEDA